MQSQCTPLKPILTLYTYLEEEIVFSISVNYKIAKSHVIRTGVTIITKTGLFPKASKTWSTQDRTYDTMSKFQRDSLVYERYQRLTATTETEGYHGSNISEV